MGAKLDFGAIPRHAARYLRADFVLYAIILVYTLVGLAYARSEGVPGLSVLGEYRYAWSVNFGIIYPTMALLLSAIHIVHRFNSRRGLAFRQMLDAERLSRFFAGEVLLFSLIFFQATFTAVKIATVQPAGFQYDVQFADLDHWLHFGHMPFELLYGLIGFGFVRHLVEINYDVVWFVICYAIFFWVATSLRADKVRLHYMLTFMATWIVVGNVVAGLFPSAGPVYYGLVTGDAGRYPDLAGFLAAGKGQFASAAEVQAYLWNAYSSGHTGIGTGISAFPSMHVTLIFMNALFINRYSRRLGLAAFAYVGLMVCSSVLLGWHYAVDSYAAIVLTILIYFGAGKLAAVVPAAAASGTAPQPDVALTRS